MPGPATAIYGLRHLDGSIDPKYPGVAQGLRADRTEAAIKSISSIYLRLKPELFIQHEDGSYTLNDSRNIRASVRKTIDTKLTELRENGQVTVRLGGAWNERLKRSETKRAQICRPGEVYRVWAADMGLYFGRAPYCWLFEELSEDEAAALQAGISPATSGPRGGTSISKAAQIRMMEGDQTKAAMQALLAQTQQLTSSISVLMQQNEALQAEVVRLTDEKQSILAATPRPGAETSATSPATTQAAIIDAARPPEADFPTQT